MMIQSHLNWYVVFTTIVNKFNFLSIRLKCVQASLQMSFSSISLVEADVFLKKISGDGKEQIKYEFSWY